MEILPLFGGRGESEYLTTLDGLSLRLRFYWLERSSRWMFNVSDSLGAPLITGLALEPDAPLLSRYWRAREEELPAGLLTLVKLSAEAGERPTFDDLPTAWALCYYTAEELQADIITTPRTPSLYIRETP